MKILNILILLILPISTFSQDLEKKWTPLSETEVREFIIGVDTVIVTKKDHAKTLARERVEFWYLKDQVVILEQLSDAYKDRISGYKNELALSQQLSSLKDSIITASNERERSYKKSLGIQEVQLKRQKLNTWLIAIGFIGTIVTITQL